jgi:hypothetical protein
MSQSCPDPPAHPIHRLSIVKDDHPYPYCILWMDSAGRRGIMVNCLYYYAQRSAAQRSVTKQIRIVNNAIPVSLEIDQQRDRLN